MCIALGCIGLHFIHLFRFSIDLPILKSENWINIKFTIFGVNGFTSVNMCESRISQWDFLFIPFFFRYSAHLHTNTNQPLLTICVSFCLLANCISIFVSLDFSPHSMLTPLTHTHKHFILYIDLHRSNEQHFFVIC